MLVDYAASKKEAAEFKELYNLALEDVAEAESRASVAEGEESSQREQSEALLKRLLEEQRAGFDVCLVSRIARPRCALLCDTFAPCFAPCFALCFALCFARESALCHTLSDAARARLALPPLQEERAQLKEQLEAKTEQQEKEARIETLRKAAGRRIQNQAITRGFVAWTELWEAKIYALGTLRRIAGKLSVKGVAAAYDVWLRRYVLPTVAARCSAAAALAPSAGCGRLYSLPCSHSWARAPRRS